MKIINQRSTKHDVEIWDKSEAKTYDYSHTSDFQITDGDSEYEALQHIEEILMNNGWVNINYSREWCICHDPVEKHDLVYLETAAKRAVVIDNPEVVLGSDFRYLFDYLFMPDLMTLHQIAKDLSKFTMI